MFKQWIAIFKKDTLMDRAYQRSFEMLDITREMFLKAKESLRFREGSAGDIDVREKDKQINSYEREVRRNVFNHLAVSGPEKLPSGLVLMSIIIDIERIGDYTKNMVDLALNHPSRLYGGKFEESVQEIEKSLENNFIKTKKSFEGGDSGLALEILNEYKWVNRACDKCLFALVKEEDKGIRPGDSVALGIYARWLKRINSHLRNITTSVINPIDRIGFEIKKQ
ncbi:MAG: PhoU domain-containing protein [Desulfobacterales bacterium]|jgi:phosphate uptake regulator|nr:PhoU domain-containing protein [Desulfobacterales bacterium]